MKTTTEIKNELKEFTGTENYYLYYNIILTDGAMWLAQEAECFWLFDMIGSLQFTNCKDEPFIVCRLRVNIDKKTGVFTADDGDDNILYNQSIPFTDFPLEEMKLYLCNGVCMLPSEY